MRTKSIGYSKVEYGKHEYRLLVTVVGPTMVPKLTLFRGGEVNLPPLL